MDSLIRPGLGWPTGRFLVHDLCVWVFAWVRLLPHKEPGKDLEHKDAACGLA